MLRSVELAGWSVASSSSQTWGYLVSHSAPARNLQGSRQDRMRAKGEERAEGAVSLG